uniref:(California timema) hypothetical protein n=1 Tax=Timema californicum TaxID=61474 RepID=A0A7R9JJ07_TIMCA|nr:unnamed protein product [Timema californicum]
MKKAGSAHAMVRNYYVWEVRRAKEASWSGFVSSTRNQNPWSLAYKFAMNAAARAVLRFIVPDDDPAKGTEKHRALSAEIYAGVDVPLFNREELHDAVNTRIELEAKTESTMETVIAWRAEAQLTFLREKTKMTLLKGKHSAMRHPMVRMGGAPIGYVRVNRMVAGVAKAAFGRLIQVSRTSWGLDLSTLRRMYKALVEQLLTYGCVVWQDRVEVKSSRIIFLKGQRGFVVRPIRWGKGTATRQVRWDGSTKGRETYWYLPSVQERMESDWVITNQYATQLFTGHGNFSAKLHGFGLKENPDCEACGAHEDAEHVLLTCEWFEKEERIFKLEVGEPFSTTTMVRDARSCACFLRYATAVGKTERRYREEDEEENDRLTVIITPPPTPCQVNEVSPTTND